MADETNTPDSQMEAELSALFAGSPPATGSESVVDPNVAADAKPGAVPPPTAPAQNPEEVPETPEELTEQEKILKALDDLDKPAEGEPKPEDKPQVPALTEDQQVILSNIPDRQSAEALITIANNHVAFEEAFIGGDFEKVEGMFTHWNKQAYDAFLENVYKKHVAQDGAWVKRFIAEQENGDNPAYQKTTALEREVAELKKQVQGRQQQETVQQQQARERQIYVGYNNKIDALFEHVGIKNEADKKFIRSAINAEVVSSKEVAEQIRKGDYKGLTQIFKANSNAYLTRDKAFTVKTETKIQEQEKKKVPLGGGGSPTQQTTADHDFKGVKRGEEDSALESKLGSFFSKFKRK